MSNHASPSNFVDLTGYVFGRLTVRCRATGETLEITQRQAVWVCDCVCGNTIDTRSRNLVRGHTKSCGCLRKECAWNVTHGATRGGHNSRVYRCWRDVIARCTNPHVKCYQRYGGAGVTVCDAWRSSFEAFARDVGEPTCDSMSIDRIDGGRGYEPGNVRWATATTQARNRRYCKLTPERAVEVRRRHAFGDSYAAIAESVGCAKSTIAMCCTGETWR